jgi:S-adenosylmethionine:tRNA ribosyltransferase-isomerase
MKKSDFYYDLPEELIAQTPVYPRDASRLMAIVGDRVSHDVFAHLCEYLHPGDLLVFNDTKVLPVRLYGEKSGSTVKVEVVLLKRTEQNSWECLTRPGRRLKTGDIILLEQGVTATVCATREDGNKILRFDCHGNFPDMYAFLDSCGHTPLPPYITKPNDETAVRERYNTVYARHEGSAAAPTAGLHFTPALLEEIRQMGADTAFVTLNVGLGTFRPVKEENILDHHMHTESYFLPKETERAIAACKQRGGRVIAVGTTSARTLEAAGGKSGGGDTDIFIYPGYIFKIIDGLITNFHLPESTLIMLISAMLGRERTLDLYAQAVKLKYRFFSFGDAMLITNTILTPTSDT